jgi:hypothetical protein
MKNMKSFNITELGNLDSITRVTLREKLGLTGAEVSVNRLPAGAEIPFDLCLLKKYLPLCLSS